jgi:uncharacterized coiled-coil protein SlyX
VAEDKTKTAETPSVEELQNKIAELEASSKAKDDALAELNTKLAASEVAASSAKSGLAVIKHGKVSKALRFKNAIVHDIAGNVCTVNAEVLSADAELFAHCVENYPTIFTETKK